MFGYITIDKDELKGKDFDRYQRFYCGLCQDLKERCGQSARATLTFDMTFLAILLSGLYEGESSKEKHFCAFHPTKKKECIRNKYTAYAADMNVLLVYHNLMDDWLDEHKLKSLAGAKILSGAYRRTAEKYPRQVKAIEDYLLALHQAEESRSEDLDLASGLTGRLMAEIFVPEEDLWSRDLREIGFFMGKLIYLMDAYDDVEKDKKSGNYNPLISMMDAEDFTMQAQGILMMMASGAAKAFERLPILEQVDILRNILYAGIWVRFNQLTAQKKDKDEIKERKNAGSL